jgi:hypothetical protein
MDCAMTHQTGKSETAAMILFGIGCLMAVLALPVLAWIQLLAVAPDWMRSALLTSAVTPVALGLAFAIARGIRSRRAPAQPPRSDGGQVQGQ